MTAQQEMTRRVLSWRREAMIDEAVRRVYRSMEQSSARELFEEMTFFGEQPAPYVWDQIKSEFRRIAQERAA